MLILRFLYKSNESIGLQGSNDIVKKKFAEVLGKSSCLHTLFLYFSCSFTFRLCGLCTVNSHATNNDKSHFVEM